jgi:hypothetical protein
MGTCVSFAFDAEDLLAWYALCSTNLPHGLPQSGAESFGLRTLYRSKDGGATFAPSADGMLAQAIPVALLADPVAPGLLYVATASSGILKSEDYGISFDAWSTGLPSPATAAANRLIARPFALSPDGAGMLLGTDGFGIYFKALASVCEE